MFNIGDKVHIKPEWCDRPSESERHYIVIDVNYITKRCIIEAQGTGMSLAPTELVGFEMIEVI